jgi:hypothetical protein
MSTTKSSLSKDDSRQQFTIDCDYGERRLADGGGEEGEAGELLLLDGGELELVDGDGGEGLVEEEEEEGGEAEAPRMPGFHF